MRRARRARVMPPPSSRVAHPQSRVDSPADYRVAHARTEAKGAGAKRAGAERLEAHAAQREPTEAPSESARVEPRGAVEEPAGSGDDARRGVDGCPGEAKARAVRRPGQGSKLRRRAADKVQEAATEAADALSAVRGVGVTAVEAAGAETGRLGERPEGYAGANHRPTTQREAGAAAAAEAELRYRLTGP